MIKSILFGVMRKCSSLFIRLYWRMIRDYCRTQSDTDPMFRFSGGGIQLYGNNGITLEEKRLHRRALTIQVHNGCRVVHNMGIYTYTVFAGRDFSLTFPLSRSGDVDIADQYWIGDNLHIRSGAVVGENSVAVRSFPEVEIWGASQVHQEQLL